MIFFFVQCFMFMFFNEDFVNINNMQQYLINILFLLYICGDVYGGSFVFIVFFGYNNGMCFILYLSGGYVFFLFLEFSFDQFQ